MTMTIQQAWQVFLDLITGKGGHSIFEIIQAGAVLLTYVSTLLPSGAATPHFTFALDVGTSDADHWNAFGQNLGIIGGGGTKTPVNWGNIIAIILKILAGLGGLGGILGGLGGAPVSGS